MRLIKPLARNDKTVTLRRRDYEALLDALEDAHVKAVFDAFDARIAKDGWDAVKANMLTGAEMDRLLAGENRVRVWRTKRGLTARALAKAAKLSPSYLADIEAGRRKGTAATLARIAAALTVDLETLVDVD